VDRANKVDGHEVRYSLVPAHFKCEPGGCRQPRIVHHRFNYDLQCPRVVRGSIRHLPNPLVTVRNSNHASPCNILLPPPHTPHTHFASQVDQVRKPTLAELLTIEPSASIFCGYYKEAGDVLRVGWEVQVDLVGPDSRRIRLTWRWRGNRAFRSSFLSGCGIDVRLWI